MGSSGSSSAFTPLAPLEPLAPNKAPNHRSANSPNRLHSLSGSQTRANPLPQPRTPGLCPLSCLRLPATAAREYPALPTPSALPHRKQRFSARVPQLYCIACCLLLRQSACRRPQRRQARLSRSILCKSKAQLASPRRSPHTWALLALYTTPLERRANRGLQVCFRHMAAPKTTVCLECDANLQTS